MPQRPPRSSSSSSSRPPRTSLVGAGGRLPRLWSIVGASHLDCSVAPSVCRLSLPPRMSGLPPRQVVVAISRLGRNWEQPVHSDACGAAHFAYGHAPIARPIASARFDPACIGRRPTPARAPAAADLTAPADLPSADRDGFRVVRAGTGRRARLPHCAARQSSSVQSPAGSSRHRRGHSAARQSSCVQLPFRCRTASLRRRVTIEHHGAYGHVKAPV
jgi:hypothetical protein